MADLDSKKRVSGSLPPLRSTDDFSGKPFTPADLADNHKSYDVGQPPGFGFVAVPTPLQKSTAQFKFALTEFVELFNRPSVLRPNEEPVRFYVGAYRSFGLFVIHAFCSTQRSGSRPRQLPCHAASSGCANVLPIRGEPAARSGVDEAGRKRLDERRGQRPKLLVTLINKQPFSLRHDVPYQCTAILLNESAAPASRLRARGHRGGRPQKMTADKIRSAQALLTVLL